MEQKFQKRISHGPRRICIKSMKELHWLLIKVIKALHT